MDFQQALKSRLQSDSCRAPALGDSAFPAINVFHQRGGLVAIVEVPGVSKADLEIQAKDNTIRISGKKSIAYEEGRAAPPRTALGPVRSHADGAHESAQWDQSLDREASSLSPSRARRATSRARSPSTEASD